MMPERDHSAHKHFGFVRDHREPPRGSRYSPEEEQRRAVEDECSLMRTRREMRRGAEEKKQ